MSTTDSDDWEYEYSTDETETFYIPIDLSNVPKAQVPFNLDRRPGHPTILKSRLRALNATRGQPINQSLDASDTATTTLGEVQVVGLHTANPLVMYNGQLLSCRWTATVGTDMFFVKPEGDAEGVEPALRSLPAVDLLALGSAKLVAKVARLQPRDELFDDAADSRPEPGVDAEMEGTAPSTSAPSVQPPPASFLARLNQAKIKRGETALLAITQASDGSLHLVVSSADAEVPTGDETSTSTPAAGDVVMGGTT
ncbi:hypothetical protein P153DRAFT_278487 [Dothidotthia symphoricarpi CBS 119687]|uniref:Transcription factor TFIIIC triple barrel domain-containing protein n=1 Tax=Dothidotthia symphoricarpi CBS 119687 TaxID=1392245 RepID=A0A6A6AWD1_9PLEO|nr:uncharacterized protein P153DRAFT_278487 [Dothidotthia symphoricarpi CBS 119687]KAF2134831.1 hypothetical protein P153DRAFT_278487 [Dothidotthia symphoricarpi CBS 119687]